MDCALTQRAKAKPTSLTKLGRLGGEPWTRRIDRVTSVSPPIMSRWIVGEGAPRELGPGVQERDRAFDLGGPEEADRPSRPRQRAARDQSLQRARDLEDAGAAAGVVVRSRRGMVEVAGIDDLLVRGGRG